MSESIFEAMKTAWSAGAVIFFEPSDVEEGTLFEEALKMVSILKYSAERIGDRLAHSSTRCIRIVTHGTAGLEIADEESNVWCEAVRAASVVDTCGSGDMVSTGLIDWMLAIRSETDVLRADNLLEGVVVGQRLAAENCAYTGARGLFKECGAAYVRQLLTQRHVVP